MTLIIDHVQGSSMRYKNRLMNELINLIKSATVAEKRTPMFSLLRGNLTTCEERLN